MKAGNHLILYIEDNADNFHLVSRVTEKLGMALIRARTASQATEQLRENGPYIDLVLADVQLPDSDQVTLSEIVRVARTYCREGVLIVALTAKAIKGDREMILAAGCDDYMSKPINIADFRQELTSKWLPSLS